MVEWTSPICSTEVTNPLLDVRLTDDRDWPCLHIRFAIFVRSSWSGCISIYHQFAIMHRRRLRRLIHIPITTSLCTLKFFGINTEIAPNWLELIGSTWSNQVSLLSWYILDSYIVFLFSRINFYTLKKKIFFQFFTGLPYFLERWSIVSYGSTAALRFV